MNGKDIEIDKIDKMNDFFNETFLAEKVFESFSVELSFERILIKSFPIVDANSTITIITSFHNEIKSPYQ